MSHRPTGGGLTAAKQAFCVAYVGVARFNATEAARRAYPNIKDADVYGTTVLRRPKVAAYVGELALAANKAIVTELEITVSRIAQELAKPAFLDPIEIFTEAGVIKPLAEMPADARRCIAASTSTLPQVRTTACRS
jgi:phage terminase small subunit